MFSLFVLLCLVISLCFIGVLALMKVMMSFDIVYTCLSMLNRNESGRFGALKSDSTHHFFRNACTKSGSLRFSQFSGC
jgi:hypothetical protein